MKLGWAQTFVSQFWRRFVLTYKHQRGQVKLISLYYQLNAE